ncbi:formylmethanofuran dehydrogenase [Anaerofilum sp. An201]|nr:FmdE family protein [Anaerofilum sp. An201]OUP04162.1 formylmethanofuran dehydrogenase [Anaerofilum sp. An201]
MDTNAWNAAVAFHGHACPGLAIGVRAALAARDHFAAARAEDEQLVCVCENDACGVDGIQAILGCTAGKGNLLFRLRGRQAFTFFERKSGRSLRLVLRADIPDLPRAEKIEWLLNAPEEAVFRRTAPRCGMPEPARLFRTCVCEVCGEPAAEYAMRLQDGRTVCLDCFSPYDRGW